MRAYEEYKESGYEWLGKIPAHWNWHYLFQACSEQLIKNKNREDLPVLSLSYGKIIIKENINFGLTPKDYADYQIVNPGNIILRLTDLQNDHKSLRTGLVENKGIITSAYTCLKSIHNSRFIHYLLHSYDCQKVFYGMGGGVRQSIGYEQIKNLKLPIPPREEQDAIVRFLDAKCAKIDRLIKLKERQIELLNEKKQNIINQAVTKGLDPHAPMKDSGVDWIGEIPEGWEVGQLKKYIDILPGYAFSSSNFKKESGTPLLRGINVAPSHIRWDDVVYWDKTIDDNLSKFLLREGDLVVGLDRPWIADGVRISLIKKEDLPCLLLQRVCRIRPKNDIEIQYLFYILGSDFFKVQLSADTTGISVPHISTKQIESFCFAIPPIDKQQEILAHLEEQRASIDSCITKIQNSIDKLIEYKKKLICDLATGKVDFTTN